MSAFYNSLDLTLSLEEMHSENHNALRKDLTQGLDTVLGQDSAL